MKERTDRVIMAILACVVFTIILLHQCYLNASARFTTIEPPADFTIPKSLVYIDKNGDVYIDWAKTEQYANSCPDFNTPGCAITRIMMAIRTEDWKPMR